MMHCSVINLRPVFPVSGIYFFFVITFLIRDVSFYFYIINVIFRKLHKELGWLSKKLTKIIVKK